MLVVVVTSVGNGVVISKENENKVKKTLIIYNIIDKIIVCFLFVTFCFVL